MKRCLLLWTELNRENKEKQEEKGASKKPCVVVRDQNERCTNEKTRRLPLLNDLDQTICGNRKKDKRVQP